MRTVGGIFTALPAPVGIDDLFALRVALYDQARLVETDLCDGSVFGEIPDDGRQRVVARFEPRCQIDGFEIPIIDVAPGRTGRDRMAIDEEFVSVVGRHMDDEAFGAPVERQFLAEVIDAVCVLRFVGNGDPHGVPPAVHPSAVDLVLSVSRQMDLGPGAEGLGQQKGDCNR